MKLAGVTDNLDIILQRIGAYIYMLSVGLLLTKIGVPFHKREYSASIWEDYRGGFRLGVRCYPVFKREVEELYA